MKNKNIAIVFDDLTEFFVMREAIDCIRKKKIPLDIIVPHDSGYNGLPEHTFKFIQKLGYEPKKDADKKKHYQILLTPYPGLAVVERMSFSYHIRYPYGALSAKPNPVYLPDTKIDYDAMLFFNTYEPKFMCAYGAKCFTVPYWKYNELLTVRSVKHKKDKPVLLLLPTFGYDISCISLFTDDLVNQLKAKYKIVAKAHHAVDFGIDGEKALERLKEISDEFYSSSVSLVELLKQADIAISDNSGAIFESICADVPVISFTKNLNQRHLGNIDTYQFMLEQQNILPHTDDPKKLVRILGNIDKYARSQHQLKKELFLKIDSSAIEKFMDIIKIYLSLDAENDYYKTLHDMMVKEWRDDKKTIQKLSKEIDDLHNSRSWKVTKPLRALKIRRQK